jgi:MFS family permease
MNLSQTFRATVQGLPALFWQLWIGTLINRLGTFVVPFLTLYLTTQRGLPVDQATLIVSLYGAGSFGAGLIGGVLADQLGRRPTMLLSFTATGVALLLLGSAGDFTMLALWTVVLGFFTDLYRPAVSATLTDVVPPQDRVRAFVLMYWAINLGEGLAPVIAGVLARQAYALLFILDALTNFIYSGIVFWRVPETRAKTNTESARRLELGQVTRALRDPGLLLLSTLAFVIAGLFFQSYVAMPLAMTANGLSEADYGAAIAVNGLLIVLISIPVSRILGRFPRFAVMSAAALLIGVGLGLNVFAETTLMYGLAVAVWTVGELMAAPIAPTIIADLAPEESRGTYQGIYTTSWGLAFLVWPAVGGFVLTYANATVLWLGCLVLGIGAAVCYLLLGRLLKERLKAVELQTGQPAGA